MKSCVKAMALAHTGEEGVRRGKRTFFATAKKLRGCNCVQLQLRDGQTPSACSQLFHRLCRQSFPPPSAFSSRSLGCADEASEVGAQQRTLPSFVSFVQFVVLLPFAFGSVCSCLRSVKFRLSAFFLQLHNQTPPLYVNNYIGEPIIRPLNLTKHRLILIFGPNSL